MNVQEICNQIKEKIDSVKTIQELNNIKVEYLGKNGIITELQSKIKEIPNEEKKEYGMKVNEVRTYFNNLYEEKNKSLEEELLNQKLENEKIDITLPATKVRVGAPNILECIVEEVEELLMSMGYDVVDGPEVEEDRFNFELLNIPKGHPARDAQDTFYLKDDEILLPLPGVSLLQLTAKRPCSS